MAQSDQVSQDLTNMVNQKPPTKQLKVGPDVSVGDPPSRNAILARFGEQDAIAPLATSSSVPPPVPTDPKGFQQYLNDHGANPPLKVDGIIGSKTKAAAQALNVPIPAELQPQATPAPAPSASDAPTAAPAQQATPASAAPAALPTLSTDQIRARYGYLGAILDFPDVSSVIGQYAADPSMSDEQFLAKLHGTPTWQTHNQNELNWLARKPQDQQALVDSQKAPIEAQAKTLGLNVSPDRLNEIATTAVKEQWNQAQMSAALAAEFHYQPGGQTGSIGAAERSIKQTAAQYLVPLADSTLAQWDAQIAAGTATSDTFRQYIATQAKTLFPSLAKGIDAGLTTDQLADPYRQMASQELGVAPESVDFTQAKWMKALSTTDPANPTGQPTMMGLADWQRTLRSDPTYGWDNTINGRTAYTQMATAVTTALGLRPGG